MQRGLVGGKLVGHTPQIVGSGDWRGPECWPLCRDGRHADLVHFAAACWTDTEVTAMWRRHGARVIEVVRNVEYPGRDNGEAHLVIWEQDT